MYKPLSSFSKIINIAIVAVPVILQIIEIIKDPSSITKQN